MMINFARNSNCSKIYLLSSKLKMKWFLVSLSCKRTDFSVKNSLKKEMVFQNEVKIYKPQLIMAHERYVL